MAKIELRLHARVMNRKQWDELDDIVFSDEVKEILGKNWLDKSDIYPIYLIKKCFIFYRRASFSMPYCKFG
jgi:hypothetical protein